MLCEGNFLRTFIPKPLEKIYMNAMIMTQDQIDQVSGGVTENQCIGAFTLAGGATAAYLSVVGGPVGWATFSSNVGLGMGAGGALGMIACVRLVKAV